jgi:Na+-driven multidrug efflux pump
MKLADLSLTLVLILVLLRPLGILGADLTSFLAYLGTLSVLVWYAIRKGKMTMKMLFGLSRCDLPSFNLLRKAGTG